MPATGALARRSPPDTAGHWCWEPTPPRSWRATRRWIPPICRACSGRCLADEADYAKGNRFAWPGCWRQMPLSRFAGNVVLSHLTRFASGYWRLFDSQCGYTVASRAALTAIDPDAMFARYGYPNDLLGRLARAGARVVDVPVRPVYGPGWRSGIRLRTVVYPIAFLLLRAFVTRVFSDWIGFGKRRRPRCSRVFVRSSSSA